MDYFRTKKTMKIKVKPMVEVQETEQGLLLGKYSAYFEAIVANDDEFLEHFL